MKRKEYELMFKSWRQFIVENDGRAQDKNILIERNKLSEMLDPHSGYIPGIDDKHSEEQLLKGVSQGLKDALSLVEKIINKTGIDKLVEIYKDRLGDVVTLTDEEIGIDDEQNIVSRIFERIMILVQPEMTRALQEVYVEEYVTKFKFGWDLRDSELSGPSNQGGYEVPTTKHDDDIVSFGYASRDDNIKSVILGKKRSFKKWNKSTEIEVTKIALDSYDDNAGKDLISGYIDDWKRLLNPSDLFRICRYFKKTNPDYKKYSLLIFIQLFITAVTISGTLKMFTGKSIISALGLGVLTTKTMSVTKFITRKIQAKILALGGADAEDQIRNINLLDAGLTPDKETYLELYEQFTGETVSLSGKVAK